jgi:hypothetical protein
MKKIGIVIHNDQNTFNVLKSKYNSMIASYKTEKVRLETLITAYNADKRALEKEINYWNGRGGAPKAEHDVLEQRIAASNNQYEVIKQTENSFNALVDTIKSAEIILNELVATLNLQVDTYNAVGSSTGKTFSEGEYVNDANGMAINVFQFSDSDQLEKVLVHELGHALGLEHLDNPKAIMYYLNEGMNVKLTADDLAALKKVCGIR